MKDMNAQVVESSQLNDDSIITNTTTMMLTLYKDGLKVMHNNKPLRVNLQSNKKDGKGDPVVYVGGLLGAGGQQWISLSRLKEGRNDIITKTRSKRANSSGWSLTDDERKQIDALQKQIDDIKAKAKERHNSKPNLKLNPSEMSDEQKLAEVEKLRKFLGLDA